MKWAPAELCTVGTYAGSDPVRQECFARSDEGKSLLRPPIPQRLLSVRGFNGGVVPTKPAHKATQIWIAKERNLALDKPAAKISAKFERSCRYRAGRGPAFKLGRKDELGRNLGQLKHDKGEASQTDQIEVVQSFSYRQCTTANAIVATAFFGQL